jgi:ketopantoate reductase
MKTSIVIGLGELGSVFATGLLKNGHQVIPVLRHDNLQEIAKAHPHPDSVWTCVAEKDIHAVLTSLPNHWKDRLVLIQNELLPQDWQQHSIDEPTVISVWFEKKAGKLPQVVLPSVVQGRLAIEVCDVYTKLGLPSRQLSNNTELLFELVLKNIYIQTTNIAGLITNGNTRDLVENHTHLMQAVVKEVIQLQEVLTQQCFDHEKLIQAFIAACYGDPNHNCMGRSAPARLARAIALAKEHQLNLPTISDIAAQVAAR